MTPDHRITPLDIESLGDFPYGDLILAPNLVVRIVKDSLDRELIVRRKVGLYQQTTLKAKK